MTFDEITARQGQIIQSANLRNILLLWTLYLIILEKGRPSIFAGTDENRIRMLFGFVGQRRNMQSTKADVSPFGAVIIGDLICSICRSDVHLNYNQIRFIVQN